jgi:hypothetical protein
MGGQSGEAPGDTGQVGDSRLLDPWKGGLQERAEARAGQASPAGAAVPAAREPAPSQAEHAGRERRVAATAQTWPPQWAPPSCFQSQPGLSATCASLREAGPPAALLCRVKHHLLKSRSCLPRG